MKPLGLILAGGQSKRLFPVETPKPLLKVDGKFLLQLAIEKLEGFDVCVICNEAISKAIKDAFEGEGLPVPRFAVEPEGRDTAAAVGFGLQHVSGKNPPWVAVLSADHWMKRGDQFPQFLKKVESEVKKYPAALFVAGSVQHSKSLESHSQFGWIVSDIKKGSQSRPVKLFVEKPEGTKLKKVRSSGGLINAGMFFGRYEIFVSAYKNLYPDVFDSKTSYSTLKRTPIDKAIFEKFDNVRVMPLSLTWEDLGTWKDWFDFVSDGKTSAGTQVDSRSVFISSDDTFEIYSFSNENLAIVQSGKKILVMPLSETKHLKKYLERIKK